MLCHFRASAPFTCRPLLIDTHSEKKIDRIEDRLAGIENVLESLAAKLGDLDLRKDAAESSSQSRSSRRGIARSPGGPLMEASTPAPFEGETAMDSQSGYGKECGSEVGAACTE
jgi:hypothetical protein